MQQDDTNPRPNFNDQAIEVLRLTDDGDQLSQRDLSLLQMVVNSSDVSELAEARWADVYSRVKAGTYKKNGLFGIDSLSIDHEGFVYWKGVSVEHYSFPADRRTEAVSSAIRLAAVCRLLEEKGTRVTGQSVMRGHDDLRFGSGVFSARYVLLWSVTGKGSPVAAAYPIESTDREEAENQSRSLMRAFVEANGLDLASTRRSEIFNADDLVYALDGLKTDIEWCRRALHLDSKTLRERESVVVSAMEAVVRPERMKSRAEFEQILAGIHFDAVRTQVVEAERAEEQQISAMLQVRSAERSGA